MTSATVTLKVTPIEMMLINEALTYYASMARRAARKSRDPGCPAGDLPPLATTTLIDGDPQKNMLRLDSLIDSLQ